MINFQVPPKNICILRLSALGDICHTLPVVRTIQSHWPQTKITWIIGKSEYSLIKGIPNIDFIVFDKKNGLKEYLKIHKQLKHLKFDILLHMQMSLRASLISLFVKSKIKLGFDRERAKDGQWLFTNYKIKYQPHQHVIDSLFGFTEALGIKEHKYEWDIPIPKNDEQDALNLLSTTKKYVVISPCSSKAYRNWNIKGYTAIANYIFDNYNYNVILTGGNSKIENIFGDEITKSCPHKIINLIGKTNFKQLLTIIKNAEFVISPDSGPAHMATAMNTPVLGLYATTNPDRARPYLSQDWVVNKYPYAVNKKYNKTADTISWGTRVRDSWAMDSITINETKLMIDKLFKYLEKNKKAYQA